MKRVILILLFVGSLGMVRGENSSAHYEQQFAEANEQYEAGAYAEAIAGYQTIVQAGFESPTLFFNLGNAYFKNNQLAPSILYFEKAKKLDPTDGDIDFNLQLAAGQTTDKIEALGDNVLTSWWMSLVNFTSADAWGIAALLVSLLLFAGLVLMVVSDQPSTKRLAFTSSGFFAILTVLFLVLAFQQKGYRENANAAIIFAPTVTVKSEPGDSGATLFHLHEGTKVTIKKRHDDWFNVSIADGKTGWLPADDLEVI